MKLKFFTCCRTTTGTTTLFHQFLIRRHLYKHQLSSKKAKNIHKYQKIQKKPNETKMRNCLYLRPYTYVDCASDLAKTQGLESWVKDDGAIEDEDVVLYHSFGVTHIPRVEDFPIMPVETFGYTLKSVNFFLCNPGLSVPPPCKSTNKSRLA